MNGSSLSTQRGPGSPLGFLIMALIILTLMLIIASCGHKMIPQRPLVIIDKSVKYSGAKYTAVDANGKVIKFEDESKLYHIGDTIE